MQTRVLAGSGARLSVRSASRRASRASVCARAQAGTLNQIGIHAQVWVGDWSKDEAVKAIKGTKDAGYDIIECKQVFDTVSLTFHVYLRSFSALLLCPLM